MSRTYIEQLWSLLTDVVNAIDTEQKRLAADDAAVNKWPPLTPVGGESDA